MSTYLHLIYHVESHHTPRVSEVIAKSILMVSIRVRSASSDALGKVFTLSCSVFSVCEEHAPLEAETLPTAQSLSLL